MPLIRRALSGARWPSRQGYLEGSDPEGAGAGVRKHTCARTRTRPLDWGVAPVPVSAASAALTDPAAKAQDVAVSWLTP